MGAQGAALVVFDETNEVHRHSSYLINLTPVPWSGNMRPIRYKRLQVKAGRDLFSVAYKSAVLVDHHQAKSLDT